MEVAEGRNGWPLASPRDSVSVIGRILDGEEEPSQVLDPFCGSGIVPYLCAMKGWKVTGLESNPFLRWSAFARSYCFGPKASENVGYAWERVAEDVFWENVQFVLPDVPDTLWFGARQGDFLKRLRNMIDRENKEEINVLLKLSFCEVLPRIYATDEESFDDRIGSDIFARSVENVRSSVKHNPKLMAQVHLCDARNIPFSLRRRYDLIVSELPHIFSNPNARLIRTYMRWMGYDDVGRADRISIGYPLGHMGDLMRGYAPDKGFEAPPELISTAREMNEMQASYVRRYFEGLNSYFMSSREMMHSRCRAYYLADREKVFEMEIDVPGVVSAIIEDAGMHVSSERMGGKTVLTVGL